MAGTDSFCASSSVAACNPSVLMVSEKHLGFRDPWPMYFHYGNNSVDICWVVGTAGRVVQLCDLGDLPKALVLKLTPQPSF